MSEHCLGCLGDLPRASTWPGRRLCSQCDHDLADGLSAVLEPAYDPKALHDHANLWPLYGHGFDCHHCLRYCGVAGRPTGKTHSGWEGGKKVRAEEFTAECVAPARAFLGGKVFCGPACLLGWQEARELHRLYERERT